MHKGLKIQQTCNISPDADSLSRLELWDIPGSLWHGGPLPGPYFAWCADLCMQTAGCRHFRIRFAIEFVPALLTCNTYAPDNKRWQPRAPTERTYVGIMP